MEGRLPEDDPAALVVRHEQGDLVYATVVGQTIDSAPGSLSLGYSRTPWVEGTWKEEHWRKP